jgi:hypothetical protein
MRIEPALKIWPPITGQTFSAIDFGPPERRRHRMDPDHHDDAASRSAGEELPACGPGDVSVTVRWEHDGGGLRGQVIAENTGSRACRLPGKPAVSPLRLDGSQLPVRTVITLEDMYPGYVILEPGQRAAAPVTWDAWDGDRASPRAQVTWQGGSATAQVQGPAQPASSYPPGNISSSWFRLLR